MGPPFHHKLEREAVSSCRHLFTHHGFGLSALARERDLFTRLVATILLSRLFPWPVLLLITPTAPSLIPPLLPIFAISKRCDGSFSAG